VLTTVDCMCCVKMLKELHMTSAKSDACLLLLVDLNQRNCLGLEPSPVTCHHQHMDIWSYQLICVDEGS
jgi:hypothetical protein